MKNKSFFKNYGLYIILLVACISGLVILGLSIFTPKSKTILMKDLKNLDKKEVVAWVDENNLSDFITYTYEYSIDVEKDKVISQSLGKNLEVDKDFNVVISKGSLAEVNNTLYVDKTSFDSFIKDYKNVIVTYSEEENEAEKGKILSFSKDKIDLKKDELTVTISLGKTEEKEEPKEEKKEDDKKVLIPGDMLGMEESKFIKTLNDLGFKNLKKDSQKYYSFKSKKDTIYSYDDGNFLTSRTINYAISLGDYISAFNKSDYENKSLADANKNVEKYNKLNAHITLKTNNVTTADANKVGLLTGCSAKKDGNNSIITCSLYVKEEKTATVPNDLYGKSETEFINKLKDLGFKNFSKDGSKYSYSYAVNTICDYKPQTYKLTDTIHYTLSLGAYTCNASDFNGKTVDQANSFIVPLNNIGAEIKFTYENKPDDSKTKNTLYDCVPNKNTITCKLANNKDKYKIVNKSSFIQLFSKTSFEATKAAVEDTYKANFVNLHFNEVKSEYAVGTIVDVRVNGSSTYATGNYDYDCSFEVDICVETEY